MLSQINAKVFIAINRLAGRNIFLDRLGILTAKYLLFVFALFLLYLWFKNGKDKNKNKEVALYSGYSALLGSLFNYLIGLFYFHPRPFVDKIGTLLINHLPDTSFPSDHTTFMLSLAFMLLYFKDTRKAGTILSLLGILGGLSRVFCGIHYPFDIVGSILVALASSCFVFMFRKGLGKLNNLIINLYYKILKCFI